MDYIERPGLIHKWMCNPEDFLASIDATGGWPLGWTHVSFFHGEERRCIFTKCELRTEWYTTVATADDYYWWKLSAGKKDAEASRARQEFANKIARMAP
jgi:hypothetical protein